MRSRVRRAFVAGLVVLPTVAVLAQGGAPNAVRSLAPKPALQHVSVETTTSAASVARGGRLTLYAEVTPKPAMHVYADGAKDFTPVSLAITPMTGVTVHATTYPEPERVPSVGVLVPVPAYTKTFRITQPVTVSVALSPGEVVLAGVLRYQACDDRLCYPAAAVPVRWAFIVQ